MSKQFGQEELAEMRRNLERNPGAHGLSVVAQLHACKKEDVITALGLDPDDYARNPPVKVTPEQKADAVARVARGESQKDIARELGVHPVTVNAWVRQAKKGAETPPQPEKADKAPLSLRPAVRLSAVAESYYDDLKAVTGYMEQADLLSDGDKALLDCMAERLWAFAQGIIRAEEHAERSAE